MDIVLAEFEGSLNQLRDWPDKYLILNITKLAEVHIQLAE